MDNRIKIALYTGFLLFSGYSISILLGGSLMNREEISNLITPEFISTLKVVLDHLYTCPNKLGLDWNEIDFLPGVMEDLVSGVYYEEV